MKKCPSCSNNVETVINNLEGYQQGKFYDIDYCKECDSSFSNPLEIDENTYNHIYKNPDKVPGYDRYCRYSKDVLKVKNPLKYLSSVEDTYWAVEQYIKKNASKSDFEILEVGCGLGYLTYSLNQAKISCTGLDISSTAINNAKANYGEYYMVADIYDYCKSGKVYDLIILTEVIEHIPDPKKFVTSLKELTKPGGSILITTPNKDKFNYTEEYWHTELPPVHLWWFSKKFFTNLAISIQMEVDFTDFTDFNTTRLGSSPYTKPWRTQTLSKTGEILFSLPHNQLKHVVIRNLVDFGIMPSIRNFFKSTLYGNNSVSSESTTLSVIMRKKLVADVKPFIKAETDSVL